MTPRRISGAVIQARLRLMQDLLDDLASLGPVDPERLRQDRVVLRALERILTQLVDLAVSVNAHVATGSGVRPPATNRESFDAVAVLNVLPDDLAAALKPSVSMRNLLVHQYTDIDLALVAAAVPLAREQYGEYARAVARWLVEHAEP
jgi:uncharacterized protein YutE (UPF0331/DUF86 family)